MYIVLKKTFFIILVFSYCFLSSQSNVSDSLRGSFTYLLTYKPNKLDKSILFEEPFSLEVSDSRSFFISENKLKFDSVFKAQLKSNAGVVDFKNQSSHGPRSQFVIIQSNTGSDFHQSIGGAKLFYKTPMIKDWTLVNESKVINFFTCKKALVHFKGRDWICWYTPDIPLSYGPYKFSGLPGLIVKITDKTGDYDFELIKSSSSERLQGKILTFNFLKFKNSKQVTQKEFKEIRKNYKDNFKQVLKENGTQFSNDRENQLEKIRRNEMKLKTRNPLELKD